MPATKARLALLTPSERQFAQGLSRLAYCPFLPELYWRYEDRLYDVIAPPDGGGSGQARIGSRPPILAFPRKGGRKCRTMR